VTASKSRLLEFGDTIVGAVGGSIHYWRQEVTSFPHFLISIRPPHVEAILAGRKTVEFRRRFRGGTAPCALWIYETRPAARVVACATVRHRDRDRPERIWENHGESGGIAKQLFDAYCDGCETVHALVLSLVTPLPHPLSINVLRDVVGKGVPPMNFRSLERKTVERFMKLGVEGSSGRLDPLVPTSAHVANAWRPTDRMERS